MEGTGIITRYAFFLAAGYWKGQIRCYRESHRSSYAKSLVSTSLLSLFILPAHWVSRTRLLHSILNTLQTHNRLLDPPKNQQLICKVAYSSLRECSGLWRFRWSEGNREMKLNKTPATRFSPHDCPQPHIIFHHLLTQLEIAYPFSCQPAY